MTAAELHALMFTAIQIQDSVFQFWLSASFAVIVATYIGRERISRRVFVLIGVLYLGASALFVARFINAATQLLYYRDVLLTNQMPDWGTAETSGFFLAAATLALISVGTVSVIVFMWKQAPNE